MITPFLKEIIMPMSTSVDLSALWLAILQRLLMLDVTDLRATLTQTANLLANAFDADKIDIFLVEPAEAMLVAYGTSSTPMGRLQHILGLDRLPLEHGGRNVWVYQTGTPYLTGHLEADPLELDGIKWELGVRSAIISPLAIDGEARGVVLVSSAQAEQYTQEHLDFLQAVTTWVGTVAHRAELVQQREADVIVRTRQVVAEDLLRVVAHDLKNFITPLSMRLTLMRKRAEREHREQDFTSATEAEQILQHFRTLVDTILDAARLEGGLLLLNPRSVDLTPLVEQSVAMLKFNEVDIVLRTPDRTVAAVDPVRFQMVVTNLISNALQYSATGQCVEVVLNGEQDEIVLRVADQGSGIAPDQLPRLFERYAAGKASTGLGLGLYVTKGIVEAHGGTITVQSVVGQGTIFEVRLPSA
jgi:two-component system OmpR family sensor kinase